ncbi:DNA replication terminus site-binding protein [Cronobacter turicensis]
MDLKKTFSTLTSELTMLRQLVEDSSPRFACVSSIPHVLRGEEHFPVTNLQTTALYGREAKDMAVRAWNDLFIRDDFSQKAARRTSGVIWYEPDGDTAIEDIIRLLSSINETKAAIEAFIVETYSTRTARFEALHNACPGVMTLHLYRQIRWWNNANIAAVRFCWQEKEALFTPDKTELLMRMGRDGESSGEMSAPMNILFKKVMSIPDHRLRIRRKVRVQPVANVTFSQGEDLPLSLKTVTATMPFIVIQHQRPEFKLLDNFSAAQRKTRRQRSDRARTEIIGTFHGESIEMIL